MRCAILKLLRRETKKNNVQMSLVCINGTKWAWLLCSCFSTLPAAALWLPPVPRHSKCGTEYLFRCSAAPRCLHRDISCSHAGQMGYVRVLWWACWIPLPPARIRTSGFASSLVAVSRTLSAVMALRGLWICEAERERHDRWRGAALLIGTKKKA